MGTHDLFTDHFPVNHYFEQIDLEIEEASFFPFLGTALSAICLPGGAVPPADTGAESAGDSGHVSWKCNCG